MRDNRLVEMRVFKMVVDAGGFTAAAHVMNVSQSFVSQTLMSLEHRLGVQLLHRSTRGDRRLTTSGEQYLRHCERLIAELEQGEAELRVGKTKVQGELRVSAPLAFGMDQIVPRLPQFQASHPELKIEISLSDEIANLIEENVDVAIRMGRLKDSTLVSRELCHLQRIVVAAPSYLDEHGIPAHPDDLTEHNCLLWHGALEQLNRWPFLIEGRLRHIAVNGNLRSSNGPTLYQMCLAGVGVLRSAEHVSLPAVRAQRLVHLLSDYQSIDDSAIYVVYLPERQLLPKIRTFVDFMIEAFRNAPWNT